MQKRLEGNTMLLFGDSVGDTVRWLENNGRSWGQSSSVHDRATKNWDLGAGYHGAVRLAQVGWEEGVKAIHNELTANFPQAFSKEPPWRYDVAGALPDVPRYLQSQPDHMLARGRAKGAKPVVNIVINTVCSAWTKSEQFVNYGAAITALIDDIESKGKRVQLSVAAVFSSLGWSNTGVVGWQVKQAGEPVDLAAIAFSLAHPAAFRRIQFGMVERTPRNWDTPGYGRCGRLTNEHAKLMDADDAFLLDGVGEDGASCSTAQGALELARAQLARAEAKVYARQKD